MQKQRKETEIGAMLKGCFLPLILYQLVNSMFVTAGMTWLSYVNFTDAGYDLYIRTGIKMLGILFALAMVLPFYKKEKNLWEGAPEKKMGLLDGGEIMLMGVFLSMGANFFLAWSGWIEQSAGYEQVAREQFSLPLWLGLIFYGGLSPLAEEVVFRGIAYKTLSRLVPGKVAVAGSALLFGLFHGNMVQMVYGTFMGVFLAVLYEKYHKLSAPVLFHGAANGAVYLCSYFL